jgi:hypothetical protein
VLGGRSDRSAGGGQAGRMEASAVVLLLWNVWSRACMHGPHMREEQNGTELPKQFTV